MKDQSEVPELKKNKLIEKYLFFRFYRCRYQRYRLVDSNAADNRLSRLRLAVRRSSHDDPRAAIAIADGQISGQRTRSPTYGNIRNERKTGHCASWHQIEEYPCQKKRRMRHRRLRISSPIYKVSTIFIIKIKCGFGRGLGLTIIFYLPQWIQRDWHHS